MDLHQVDCVIHLATEYGRDGSIVNLLRSNVIFPISLIETGLKKQLKLFINTDSFFAKSEFKQTYLKDYTDSKRILEKLLKDFSERLNIVNLRIEHVFGENDAEQKFFTAIIKKLLKNEPIIELTEGRQKRDFIYAGDAAEVYVSVIKYYEQLNKYQEYQVGYGHSISVREFVEKIAETAGSTSVLNFGGLPSRENDILDSYAEVESLNKIGWQQKYNIDSAIKLIIKKERERFRI